MAQNGLSDSFGDRLRLILNEKNPGPSRNDSQWAAIFGMSVTTFAGVAAKAANPTWSRIRPIVHWMRTNGLEYLVAWLIDGGPIPQQPLAVVGGSGIKVGTYQKTRKRKTPDVNF